MKDNYDNELVNFLGQKFGLNIEWCLPTLHSGATIKVDDAFFIEPIEEVEERKSIRGVVQEEVIRYLVVGEKEYPSDQFGPGYTEPVEISNEKTLEDAFKKIMLVKLEEEFDNALIDFNHMICYIDECQLLGTH